MASGHRGSTIPRQPCADSWPSICRAYRSAARATRPTQTNDRRRTGITAMADAMLHPEFETLGRRCPRAAGAPVVRAMALRPRHVGILPGETRSLPARVSAYAPTIAETAEGVVAAWFGAPRRTPGRRHLARTQGGRAMVRAGRGRARRRTGRRPEPCGHPVLHQAARGPSCCSTRSGRTRGAGGACYLPPQMAGAPALRPGTCPAGFSVRSRTSRWRSATVPCSVRPAPSIWIGALISSALRTW
jgi:hypothetical protein